MSLPEPVLTVAEALAQTVGETALEALLRAFLGHRNPRSAVERATVQVLAQQAYRRPDLKGQPAKK